MRAQQQPFALRFRLLSRDEQRILRVPRRMIRRKIQRLEVVVIRLDHGTFSHRVAQLLKDANHLVGRFNNRMLRPNRPPNARKGNINLLLSSRSAVTALGRSGPQLGNVFVPFFGFHHDGFNFELYFVNPLPNLTLTLDGSALSPKFIDLRQHAVLSCEPSIAKGFPLSFTRNLGFLVESGQQFGGRAIQSCR